jgi:hypothetical protein
MRFKIYPEFPRIWDNTKTEQQNKDVEDREPGALSRHTWVEMDAQDSLISKMRYLPKTTYDILKYPSWYQPLLRDRNAKVTAPAPSKHSFYYPNMDDVVCQTTMQSGSFDDCVHAFGGIETSANWNNGITPKNNNGDKRWPSYVHSCAIQIHYKGDWSNCRANWGDIWAHAMMVFEGCHSGLATVGGYVPFGVANCPATIDIVPTNGGPAPGMALEDLSASQVE